jgi:TolB-like protein
MKKLILLICLFFAFTHYGFAQGVITLDRAIRNSVDYFTDRLPKGTKIAISNFASPQNDLSEHVVDDLVRRFIDKRSFVVVDRTNLEVLQRELIFQMSGEVSLQTAQSIGEKIGAQTIFSGSINRTGNTYQFRVRAISVKTAEIQGVYIADIGGRSIDRFFEESPNQHSKSSDSDVLYFSWAKKYAKRNNLTLLALHEIDDKYSNICYELSAHYSFLPFTSVGINTCMAMNRNGFNMNTDYYRVGVGGSMGLVLPISSRINLFGDGLMEAASGIHFGYAAGITTRLYKNLGIELKHKGMWYNNKPVHSFGLGVNWVF